MLGLSLSGWENAMVMFLIIAGFFALIAGAATWAVVKLQRIEIAASKSEFERYKIDAAGKIAVANVVGASALADAAKANKRAEELRADNLALQAGVRPRRLSFFGWTMKPDGVAKLYEALDKFSGTTVLIQAIPDFEPQTFARDIASVLAGKKWNVRLVSEKESKMADTAIPEGVSIFSLTDSKIDSDAGVALWRTMLGAFHEMGMMPPATGPAVINWGSQRHPWDTFNFDPPVSGLFVCVGRPSSTAFLEAQRKELVRQQQDWDDNLKAMVRGGHKLMSQATDGTMVETMIGPDGGLISADPTKKLVEPDRDPTLVLPGGIMFRSAPPPDNNAP